MQIFDALPCNTEFLLIFHKCLNCCDLKYVCNCVSICGFTFFSLLQCWIQLIWKLTIKSYDGHFGNAFTVQVSKHDMIHIQWQVKPWQVTTPDMLMEYMQLIGISPWELFPLYLWLIGVWTSDDNSKFWTGPRSGLQVWASRITWTGHVTNFLLELDPKLDPLCMNPIWKHIHTATRTLLSCKRSYSLLTLPWYLPL
jgi:hypothetical protein